MIWLTWRQHRLQAEYLALGLAVMAAVLYPLGRSMHGAFAKDGLAACLSGGNPEFVTPGGNEAAERCHDLAEAFLNRFGALQPVGILLVFLPLVAGLFLGAPLVARELEHGTHRLVWTQGVSRMRWATTKFGLIGLTAAVLAAGYAAFLTWWIGPLNSATGSRLNILIFDLQGVVPLAYTLFAVALGIAAGTVTRKLLPAMAITLAGFILVRVLLTWLARPHYLAQVERKMSVLSDKVPNELHGDWVISTGIYDAAGKLIQANASRRCVPGGPPAGAAAPPDLAERCDPSFYNLERIQPAGRFWPFQWIESGIFAALAAGLLVLALYRVRRRIA